jgi:hypothetical protein
MQMYFWKLRMPNEGSEEKVMPENQASVSDQIAEGPRTRVIHILAKERADPKCGTAWVAHALELDLVAVDDGEWQAISKLATLIQMQIDFGVKNKNEAHIPFPAPPEYFAELPCSAATRETRGTPLPEFLKRLQEIKERCEKASTGPWREDIPWLLEQLAARVSQPVAPRSVMPMHDQVNAPKVTNKSFITGPHPSESRAEPVAPPHAQQVPEVPSNPPVGDGAIPISRTRPILGPSSETPSGSSAEPVAPLPPNEIEHLRRMVRLLCDDGVNLEYCRDLAKRTFQSPAAEPAGTQPAQEGWISVEERLPEMKEIYKGSPLESPRLSVYNGRYVTEGKYQETFERRNPRWIDYGGRVITVTHWQPLPKPPRGASAGPAKEGA